MKAKSELPYRECNSCQDLGDCPYVEIMVDGLGSPRPPADCPKYNEIMKRVEKKKRKKHDRGIA